MRTRTTIHPSNQLTKKNQFVSNLMIRTKENLKKSLSKAFKHKCKPSGGFRGRTIHSRLKEWQLEARWSKRNSRQRKIYAITGANVGVEEAPVPCNIVIERALHRCNTMSLDQRENWWRIRELQHTFWNWVSMKGIPRYVFDWRWQ